MPLQARTATTPLSEPVLYALLALCEEPLHGYAIILRVEDWTEGRIRLRTATLYTALGRLLDSGLIEEVSDASDKEAGDGRRGRVYRVTAGGRSVVRAETRRLDRLVAVAHAVGAA